MGNSGREKLGEAVCRQSERVSEEGRKTVSVLSGDRAGALASEYGCHLRRVFEVALLEGVLPFRYLRNQNSLSTGDQLRLCRSCAAVVGAGGLGGYAADLLARMGIGALVLVDPDVFAESNLNRQRFAVRESLGRPKAAAVRDFLASVNPAVEVFDSREQLGRENGAELLAGADVVVDGLDSIADRLVLQEVCEKEHLPFVHAAIAGFEAQVLSVMPGEAGLKNLYGEDLPPGPGPERELGVPAPTPLMAAGLQVMEVRRILLQDKARLSGGRMLYLDLERPGMEIFGFGNLQGD
ncbi:MAG: ThiF family adenylyltransferase [Desulfosalsimonadaceae bacterium]